MGRLRAVVAARISILTDESVSIQRQVKSGEKYAALKDWPVVGYVKDEDVSATKVAPFDRPSLAAWITRSDEWDVLIFWKLDRVVRSPADLWDMVRWCDEHGKSLVFVEDNFDLSTEMGRAMATIAAVFARMEAANMSARRIAANKELRTTVRWTSSRPPYPFMSVDAPDGKGKVLVRDPESYAITREIGTRVLDKQSRYSIMADLNERGVLSPSDHHRKRTGKPLKGTPWGMPTINNILMKLSTQGIKIHSTTGKAKDAKPVIGDDGMPLRIAEPTFTDKEWTGIQHRLAETEGSHHQRTAGVASPHLDVLICKCGKNLYRNRHFVQRKTRGGQMDNYSCRNRAHMTGKIPALPPAGTLPTEDVHRLIETLLLEQYGEQSRMRKVFVPGEDHSAELEQVKAAIERLRDDREAGDYDGDEAGYRSRMDRLRTNRDRLAAMPHRPDGWRLEDTGEKWADWWRSADERERRDELIRTGVKVYMFRPKNEERLELGLIAAQDIPALLADPSAPRAQRVVGDLTKLRPPADGA